MKILIIYLILSIILVLIHMLRRSPKDSEWWVNLLIKIIYKIKNRRIEDVL